MKTYKRWIGKSVLRALRTRRIVNIAGARQVGKTTLTKMLDIPDAIRRSLDDAAMLSIAQSDPKTFVSKAQNQTLVIDEIQKSLPLLSAMKMVVDENSAPGQFLITGSADLRTIPAAKESLAGRMRTVRLRCLAQGEIAGRDGDFIAKLFSGGFENFDMAGEDKRKSITRAFAGGYPEAIRLETEDRKEWFEDYIETLLVHDIKDVSEIRKTETLRKVFEFLAARSSKLWNVQELSSSIGISRVTAESYFAALKRLYLFDEVPAWTDNDYKRTIGKSKYFICDTGLMANSLDWNEEETMFNSDKSGKLIETSVYNEIAAMADMMQGCKVYHYRDHYAREIDFLIKDAAGDLAAVEVKSSATAHGDDFKIMRWFDRNVLPLKTMAVVYCGASSVKFADKCWAIPLAML